ncbi:DUF6583 family protein [Staphylococcus cohnii]|uniref:Uncharacterized protein n=1 Tax=Staphylococcus cohnii subsp. cohnii TaxID=74704 RepID=A0A0M2NZC0_STACC|nr:DUF6583 family protein [Staphylococcus cohnii]KKI65312.1 hypothetical protein UF66_1269 [Staphylococcus cohnii subsp. cohnii]
MSKTVKIVISVVIGVLLIAGIGGAAYYFFTKNTPKNTYLLSEKETANQFQEYAKDRFENEFKFQDKMKDESYLIDLKANADVPKNLLESSGIPKSVADASEIGLTVGHDPKKEKSILALNPTIADNEIGKFQWAADKDNQYYASPLFNDIYKAKNDELVDVYEKITGDTSSTTGKESVLTNDTLNLNSLLSGSQISQKDIEKLSSKYTDVVIDKLDKDNFEKENATIDVDGDEKDVKKVTLKLSKGETKEIVKSVLEKAKKDKDIKKIAEDQFKTEDYEDKIDEAIQEVKDQDKNDFPSIKSVIWEEDNLILKRELTAKDKNDSVVKLTGTNQIDDDKLAMNYKITADDTELSLKGKSTKDDDKYKDNYTIGANESYKKSTIKLSNNETQDGDKRTDKGKVSVDANYRKTEFEYNNNLETDVKNNTQKQDFKLTTDVQYQPVTFNIKGETKLKDDIKFEKSGAEDLNELSDSDLKKLQKEISKKAEGIVKDLAKDFKK